MTAHFRVSGKDTFWAGRRVLVTGHTGFKGSWLTAWLHELGAEQLGLSLAGSPAPPRLWDELAVPMAGQVGADLATPGWEQEVVDFDPEVVLHLAAQALVPVGYAQPLLTFTSNVQGTARVLEVLARLRSLLAVLVVTTDKVYDPRQPPPHAERDFLGGHDPYSASKAATEILVASWPDLPVPVATARAGNVIGGGDLAPDRLLPDVVRRWAAGRPVSLRNAEAVRPWQHVLEPLCGYLQYAEALATGAQVSRALNFGPTPGQLVQVREVVEHARVVATEIGTVVPDPATTVTVPHLHENPLLEIDSTLALEELGWTNRLGWEESVRMAVSWYARHAAGESASDLVAEQLRDYCDLLGAGA